METELITKLLLAHIIGDFLLQPKMWIENKMQKKWKSPYLLIHSIIHFLLILLITWDSTIWKAALFITVSHFLIDGIKLTFQKNKPRFWFFADQIAHVVMIFIALQLFLEPIQLPAVGERFWIIITGLIFLTYPTAFIMQHVLSKWNDEVLNTENSSYPVPDSILVYLNVF